MEQKKEQNREKIILLFKDGIVDFDEVAHLWFPSELSQKGMCKVTLKNGKEFTRKFYKLNDAARVQLTLPLAGVRVAMFVDPEGSVSTQKYLG